MKHIIREDQRLCILLALKACNNDANQNILQSCLSQLGHSVSIDNIRTHMSWLEEQGLLVIDHAQACGVNFYIGNITQRGLDVANGRAVVAGVKKPAPQY